MGISPHWDDVHYCCPNCNKVITKEYLEIHELSEIVKCPSCNGPLHVYASTKDWNYTLIRKYVYELRKGDLVLLRSTLEDHEVLNVEEVSDKIKVALGGHGVVKLPEDDWVDCVWGQWNGQDAPWNGNN